MGVLIPEWMLELELRWRIDWKMFLVGWCVETLSGDHSLNCWLIYVKGNLSRFQTEELLLMWILYSFRTVFPNAPPLTHLPCPIIAVKGERLAPPMTHKTKENSTRHQTIYKPSKKTTTSPHRTAPPPLSSTLPSAPPQYILLNRNVLTWILAGTKDALVLSR